MQAIKSTPVTIPQEEQMTLYDGRQLAYYQFGAREGFPIFYFHGWPSNALDGAVFHEASINKAVRLIAINRPGIGRSTIQPGRQLLDFPDDIQQVADALGLNHFSVLGQSGGGPYALACAYKLGQDRLIKAGISAGMFSITHPVDVSKTQVYPDRISFRLHAKPTLLRLLMGLNTGLLHIMSPEMLLKMLVEEMPEKDKQAFNQEAVFSAMKQVLIELRTASSRGLAEDARVIMNAWEFDLRDIETTVLLWHGEMDPSVPVSASEWYATQLAHSELTVYPEEGHGVLLNHIEAVLESLLPA